MIFLLATIASVPAQTDITETPAPSADETITKIGSCQAYNNDFEEYVTSKKDAMSRLSRYVQFHSWNIYSPEIKIPNAMDTVKVFTETKDKYVLVSEITKTLVNARTFCKDSRATLFKVETYEDFKTAQLLKLPSFWLPLKSCQEGSTLAENEALYADGVRVPPATDATDNALSVKHDCVESHTKFVFDYPKDGVPKITGYPSNAGIRHNAVCEIPKTIEFMALKKLGAQKVELQKTIDKSNPAQSILRKFKEDVVLKLRVSDECSDLKLPVAPSLTNELNIKYTMDYLSSQQKFSPTGIVPVADKLMPIFSKISRILDPTTIENELDAEFKGEAFRSDTGKVICDCSLSVTNTQLTTMNLQVSVEEIKADLLSVTQHIERIDSVHEQTNCSALTTIPEEDESDEGSVVGSSNPLTPQHTGRVNDLKEPFTPPMTSSVAEDADSSLEFTQESWKLINERLESWAKHIFESMSGNINFQNSVTAISTRVVNEHNRVFHNKMEVDKNIRNEIMDVTKEYHLWNRLDAIEKNVASGTIHSVVQDYLDTHSDVSVVPYLRDQFNSHQDKDHSTAQIKDIAKVAINDQIRDQQFQKGLEDMIERMIPVNIPVTLKVSERENIISAMFNDVRLRNLLTKGRTSGVQAQETQVAIPSGRSMQSVNNDLTTQAATTQASVVSHSPKITKTPKATVTTGSVTTESPEGIKEELLTFLKEVLPDNIYEFLTLVLSVCATLMGIINCYNPTKDKLCKDCFRKSESSINSDLINNLALVTHRNTAENTAPTTPTSQKSVKFVNCANPSDNISLDFPAAALPYPTSY